MSEFNKLVLYNGQYDHFVPQIDFLYNFNKFLTSGKCGTDIYYFKDNDTRTDNKINNLVYINWVALLYGEDRDKILEQLKQRGLLDLEYSAIIIEKGFPRESVQFILDTFKVTENYSLFSTPFKFSEQLCMAIDKIRGELNDRQ